ncbi:MAG TPA: DUF1003 domain-containing protein, partial [Candidatus Paceibacterota bacterium]|nr:DUF1003 domain-containing protein [Candidatus Paceibacterota bacterium]
MKSHPFVLPSKKAAGRKNTIKSFKAKADARRTTTEVIADFLTRSFGTVSFLVLNAIFFIVWIAWNMGLTPFPVMDPFPFGLLTMVVSL